jgi:hypothetical protein
MKNFLRWRKFVKRIRAELPKYHPDSGVELDWDIQIYYRHCKYNSNTGERIQGFPYLSLHQNKPRAIVVDPFVYRFNWKKKEIEQIQGARWM